MPLPLVPLVLFGTGAASAVGGAASFVHGSRLARRARREAETSAQRYEAEFGRTKDAVAQTNGAVAAYGEQQRAARRAVVERMADFLRRNEQAVSERASLLLDRIVIDERRVEDFTGAKFAGADLLANLSLAVASGAVTYTAIPLTVAAHASASTGTAIATLGGAAAKNATLAYLGGGSLVAGGGGMALGAMALNAVTIGPTILISGLAFAGRGQRALTEANEYGAEVDDSLNAQHRLRNRLEVIDRYVAELGDLLEALTEHGATALDELEAAEPFDPDTHAQLFQHALTYAFAVRDVVSVLPLEPDGELDPDAERLVVTYKDMR